MTRSEERDLRSKSENLHGERLKNRAAAPNAFKESFSIIYILQNNVDKKCLFAPHEILVQKLIESRIIRKLFFWIVGPFTRIASHMSKIFRDKMFKTFSDVA